MYANQWAKRSVFLAAVLINTAIAGARDGTQAQSREQVEAWARGYIEKDASSLVPKGFLYTFRTTQKRHSTDSPSDQPHSSETAKAGALQVASEEITTSTRVWYSGETLWRFSRDFENDPKIRYSDGAKNATKVWRMTQDQLSLLPGPSGPAIEYRDPSSSLAVYRDAVLASFFGYPEGMQSPCVLLNVSADERGLWQIHVKANNGGTWKIAIRKDADYGYFPARIDRIGSDGTTIVASWSFGGELSKIGARVCCSEVTLSTTDGRYREINLLQQAVGVSESEVTAIADGPDKDGNDPIRGHISVKSTISYSDKDVTISEIGSDGKMRTKKVLPLSEKNNYFTHSIALAVLGLIFLVTFVAIKLRRS